MITDENFELTEREVIIKMINGKSESGNRENDVVKMYGTNGQQSFILQAALTFQICYFISIT